MKIFEFLKGKNSTADLVASFLALEERRLSLKDQVDEAEAAMTEAAVAEALGQGKDFDMKRQQCERLKDEIASLEIGERRVQSLIEEGYQIDLDRQIAEIDKEIATMDRERDKLFRRMCELQAEMEGLVIQLGQQSDPRTDPVFHGFYQELFAKEKAKTTGQESLLQRRASAHLEKADIISKKREIAATVSELIADARRGRNDS